MDIHKTLADGLGDEVLTEMAGTFFGARKALDDLLEDFKVLMEELRAREAKVYSRVCHLRSLLLGAEGEAAFFAELGLSAPFADSCGHSGSRTWRPESPSFAFFASTRYLKAVLQAYAELRLACEAYMVGEYEEDPEQRGRKRLSPHFRQIERHCARLNERIEKLNTEMTPSSVLQFARSINAAEEPGQGVLENSLGAESLDDSMKFQKIDFAALGVWKAPSLPPVESCEAAIRRFCTGWFKKHGPQIKKVLADLE